MSDPIRTTIAPISPVSDHRVSHEVAVLEDVTYHYLLGVPDGGEFRGTVFLIHGWPDISMGWRYQIPALVDMGLRVVCPDLIGFGSTDAPPVPPESLEYYSAKRASDDIAKLAKQLGCSQIILGGHDWGGMVVWRCALWHPELVSHVFSVCTPYTAPSSQFVSTEDLVNGPIPQFGYQIQLASGEVEKHITTKKQIRQFLNGMYYGKGSNNEYLFTPEKGINFENLDKIGPSKLLDENEMNYYVEQYSKNGLHGTLNWYRTRKINYDHELALKTKEIKCPCLFVQATRDSVLTPALSRGMEKFLPDLTRKEVEATHWALWEKPEEVNGILREWIEQRVFGDGGGKSKL